MRARPLLRVTSRSQSARSLRDGATLAALAAVGPMLAWIAGAIRGAPAFNDFNVYWLAGQLVDRGTSPFDGAALADLAARQGRDYVLGGGYSYPLPFAIALIPLGRLPFESALGLFLGGSVVLFAVAVAAWLRWAGTWVEGGRDIPLGRLRVAALLAGCFPPVLGSVATGQANLLVLAALAAGTTRLLSGRTAAQAGGGVLVGLAAVVKLVPAVAVVPLVLGRRPRAAAAVLVTGGAAIMTTALVAPRSSGGSDSLLALLDPDPYFTNASINGFVSRLVLTTERTRALVPGLFDAGPVMALATGTFGLLTAWVLWRARAQVAAGGRGLALGIGFAILAGVIGGPKDSYWNASLALVPAGLLVATAAPDLDARWFARLATPDRRLLGIALAGVFLQPLAWLAPAPLDPAPLAWAQTLVGSVALVGLLALWLVMARWLSAPGAAAQSQNLPGRPASVS